MTSITWDFTSTYFVARTAHIMRGTPKTWKHASPHIKRGKYQDTRQNACRLLWSSPRNFLRDTKPWNENDKSKAGPEPRRRPLSGEIGTSSKSCRSRVVRQAHHERVKSTDPDHKLRGRDKHMATINVRECGCGFVHSESLEMQRHKDEPGHKGILWGIKNWLRRIMAYLRENVSMHFESGRGGPPF